MCGSPPAHPCSPTPRHIAFAQASIRECTQEEIGSTTRLGASMQPAMKAGNPAKGKPPQAPEHGGVDDQDPGVGDDDHGDQIVDPPGSDRRRCCRSTLCARLVAQAVSAMSSV